MLCYPCVSGLFPHVVIASVHHVCEGGFVFMTVSFVVAFGTGVCAVAMGPAILCGSGTVVVVVIATSSVSVAAVALVAISIVAASITASSTIVVAVVVFDLGLYGCHGYEEGFHCCCVV